MNANLMDDVKAVLKLYGACSQQTLIKHLNSHKIDLKGVDVPSLLHYATQLSGELSICIGARNKILYQVTKAEGRE